MSKNSPHRPVWTFRGGLGALALVLSSIGAIPAHAATETCSVTSGETIELCSVTTFTADAPRAMRVHLSEPQTIGNGSIGPGAAIDFSGGGQLVQFMLLADVPHHADFGLIARWFPVVSRPTLRGSADLYHPDPQMAKGCTPAQAPCVLPAGTYVAYVLPHEGQATVTLRFSGLEEGSLALDPDLAVDYQVRSLTPGPELQPAPAYSAGDPGTLTGQGLLGVANYAEATTSVAVKEIGCMYLQEPPAYLPECPGSEQGGGGQVVNGLAIYGAGVGMYTFTTFHGWPAGSYGLGSSITSGGTLDKVQSLGYWFTFLN
jgi:hypothetical protein